MNNETKKMLHENNKLEEQLSEKSNQIFTDMIVYLRGSDISEYNQEVVRRDIIEMIIEGEKRGDDIDEIIGNNYKNICDEIISVFPNKTFMEKIIDSIEMILFCVYILGTMSAINVIICNILNKGSDFSYNLSIGDIINSLLFMITANIIIKIICKNTFKRPQFKNKILSYLVIWLVCMVIFGCFIGIGYFLDYVVIKINIFIMLGICGVTFTIKRWINSKGNCLRMPPTS